MATAAATRLFYPCDGQRLLEHLDLQRLAPQQPLQIAHAGFQLAHPASRDYLVVGLHCHLSALGHATPPPE
ncbi:hypothetical protein, partial [Methylobacterium soli]|uniref:hypothetical protein n=1 Tax=Methylobacterium soli TaxID=553447 RepID=UPI001EE1590C